MKSMPSSIAEGTKKPVKKREPQEIIGGGDASWGSDCIVMCCNCLNEDLLCLNRLNGAEKCMQTSSSETSSDASTYNDVMSLNYLIERVGLITMLKHGTAAGMHGLDLDFQMSPHNQMNVATLGLSFNFDAR
jgi:hypothetical protein